MPFLESENLRLFYRLEGKAELPVLVLSHSLGADHAMWQPQMPELLEHFAVLRYDTRGHGASAASAGEYSIEQLGRDVLALAEAFGIEKFAFCGLSMGGGIGQWLALHAPQWIAKLALANTSPKFGNQDLWNTRIQLIKQGGMAAVVDASMERFFSAPHRNEAHAQSIRRVLLGTDPAGYLGCCFALRDLDFRQELGRINLPALVIGSEADPSTPWEGNGELLARGIKGARTALLHGAHLSNLEQPQDFTAALLGFLLEK